MLSTVEMFTGVETQVDSSGFKNKDGLTAQGQRETVFRKSVIFICPSGPVLIKTYIYRSYVGFIF